MQLLKKRKVAIKSKSVVIPAQKSALLSSPFVHIVLICAIGILAYSNIFNSPFQWDEIPYIAENPLIKDLNYFLEPSKAEGFEFYNAVKMRYIGYLTFALNYKLHNIDVRGYHIFNISIHILNAFLMYFLVLLTFRTPYLRESPLKEHSKYIALFSALLFVSHPIQTEAVTYIFQRLASLCAFFYLLSLVLYIKWRLSVCHAGFISAETLKQVQGDRINSGFRTSGNDRINSGFRTSGNDRKITTLLLYLASLLSAMLSMKTKENAFTLPIVITLYEFFFFKGDIKKRILWLIPILLTLLIIPLTLIDIDKPLGEMITDISAIRGYPDISRLDYLLTQFRVIVTYIRLLFIPVNQNIDYDYPVFHSFLNPQVFLSFLFLLSIFGLSVYLFYRSRVNSRLRLISFGIFWFLITLSVESSIIPLPMVINEYRVYLPSVGAFMAVIAVAFLFIERVRDRKIETVLILLLIVLQIVFAGATYARNTVWGSKTGLWEDAVQKSPKNPTAHYNLGNVYFKKGLSEKSIEHLQTAIKLKPDYIEAHYDIGVVYQNLGLLEEAIKHYQFAVILKPDLAEAHNNLGNLYKVKGHIDKAVEHLRIAIRLNPDNAAAYYNLGLAYLKKGDFDRARKELETALKINPQFYPARQFLDHISKPE